MNTQIGLHGVSHFFDTPHGRISLFNDVDLVFEGGKTHAIVGPSGVGKSSLLSLAAGLEPPRKGEVTFVLKGRELTTTQLRRNSGFVFQQFHLLPELDALGNIALPLKLEGDRQALAKASDWLERVNLRERAGHKPSHMSGGEQQRVAIARAFATDPAFVFADEPTGNLDAATSSSIIDLMFGFAEETGAALIVVTHSDALARRAHNRLALSPSGIEAIA
ncbi:ABC transporter ATP-binding protein [Erythrobacter sp. KY5]|uniref:ABC transporter ATP-binding protein n=1 Tax=Erythrobacter sp. KY5 TaxID=2011159 RepID=UPI000DBF1D92|nr:ABC transporter ATP-binding protein [Erythrobacter sp. KY5]AWW75615.1 ABC transporter ATP-binding protein [Erythrobacter sp. KY5]